VGADEETLKWEIATLRAAISADWVALASRKTSDPETRKAVRDHLDLCTSALREATEKLEVLLNERHGPRAQGIPIDLEKLADAIMPPPLS
jgi:hypothetical protein